MRHRFFKNTIFTLVSLLLLLGCGIGAIADQAASLSSAVQISKVENIIINDDWMGLSDVGPMKKYYDLKVSGNQIVGRAIFSLGGGERMQTREVPITIPQLIAEDFFRVLGASPLKKGKYQAKVDHTDDYPSRKILLGGGGNTIEFYSESQGEFAEPWGLTWNNGEFTIDAKNPMQALLKIKPYLKEKDFESFLSEVRKSNPHR